MKTLLPRLRNAQGFSLVEVVIALGLATFAMTSILALLPTGLSATKECRGSLDAMRAADRVLADLRHAVPNKDGVYQSVTYQIPFNAETFTAALAGETGNGSQLAEVKFLSRPSVDGKKPGLYEVVVYVFWGLPENAKVAPLGSINFVTLYGAFTK